MMVLKKKPRSGGAAAGGFDPGGLQGGDQLRWKGGGGIYRRKLFAPLNSPIRAYQCVI